jgi:hypothetical protein
MNCKFDEGRIAILDEAALFSVQRREQAGKPDFRFGMTGPETMTRSSHRTCFTGSPELSTEPVRPQRGRERRKSLGSFLALPSQPELIADQCSQRTARLYASARSAGEPRGWSPHRGLALGRSERRFLLTGLPLTERTRSEGAQSD